jgi:hypothetical protein
MTSDMGLVIVPKSDQLNSDDLISGPITITITRVELTPGTEQPVVIRFDGDNNKPFKPCKSMSKVMVHCWGRDANVYAGRSMTLYRDDKVKWGGMAVGGIRISHMTDIDRDITMALTETKQSRKPFTVRPLHVQLGPDRRPLENAATEAAGRGADAFRAWYKDVCSAEDRAYLKPSIGVYQDTATKADAAGNGAAANKEKTQ